MNHLPEDIWKFNDASGRDNMCRERRFDDDPVISRHAFEKEICHQQHEDRA